MELYTTLRLARRNNACSEKYKKAEVALGPDWADDTPIPLSQILASNGIEDVIWCFRALTPESPDWWKDFALDCAERSLPSWEKRYPDQDAPRRAIEMARLYRQGKASEKDTYDAAHDAAIAAYAVSAISAVVYDDALVVSAISAVVYDDALVVYPSHAHAVSDDERKWQAERFLAYTERETPCLVT